MKKGLVVSILAVSLTSFGTAGFAEKAAKGASREELFKKHCAVCHPDGGNVVNPKFTLHKKDLQAHGVAKAGNIVGKMRKPGPGMTQFDKKTIPDKDAQEIAEYILKTFK